MKRVYEGFSFQIEFKLRFAQLDWTSPYSATPYESTSYSPLTDGNRVRQRVVPLMLFSLRTERA